MSSLTRQSEPLEGVVVEYDRTRLPQGFIEATTEYDYAELPDYLRADLERWCDVFRAWDQSKRRAEDRP